MKVFYLPEVVEAIELLSELDKARIDRTREFFEQYAFQLGPKYIKKVTSSGIWELRAGRMRIFMYIVGDKAIGVHIIHKKTNKLPKRDILLAEKRSKKI